MKISVLELISKLQNMRDEMCEVTGEEDFMIGALMHDKESNTVYGIEFNGIYNDDNSYILLELSN